MDNKLKNIIMERIRASGSISFAEFMQMALYEPGLGYYQTAAPKIGEQGDFVTSPELSPMFSWCVANQCMQIAEATGLNDVLEIGAGTGRMAADICDWYSRHDHSVHYRILEESAELKKIQHALLQDNIDWIDKVPQDFSGIVIANEWLDAIPTHRFVIDKGEISELGVCCNEDQFAWCRLPAKGRLMEYAARVRDQYGLEDVVYKSEVNLLMEGQLEGVLQNMQQGVVILIDYGYSDSEYYLPERNSGTVTCHYRHQVNMDPLVNVGLQDITSYVNFTQVAEIADRNGFQVAGYTNQNYFLFGCGLEQIYQKAVEDHPQPLILSQQIKQLTLPGELGERFRVIALTKNVDVDLQGFSFMDFRERL